MRRFALFALLIAGLAASLPARSLAEEEHGPASAEASQPGAGGEVSLPDAIFNHVANESELEFPNPFNGQRRVVELPQWKHAFGLAWLDLSVTKHTVWMWVAGLAAILVFNLWRPRSIAPKGAAVLLEILVLFVRDEIAKPTIGEQEHKRYTPYLLTVFFFILFMNLLGAIPYTSTPTGNLAVTAGLAVCTFAVTQLAGIRAAGLGGYFKHLTGGVPFYLWPIMVPVEVMGLFTKPFALCVRLFANMVAGHIVIFFLLGMIFIFNSIWVSPVSVTFAVGIYLLEIFVALIQAYVFTILSSLFIGMAVAMGHHGHEGHHHADHDPELAP